MTHQFPHALEFLFEPSRYKVLYGGRGGAKSWGVARALLIQGAAEPIRILCAREFQNSIADSVHKLLSDQIADMGLSSFYEVQNAAIKGLNGTEFAFAGLRHNVARIKSFEGVDRVWVEEAQTVSKASWETLVPTIRKDGSEIWITFNPELDTDETYKRFVINPPLNAIVRKIGYQDNPWFPKVLDDERLALQARDPDAYLTVWEGHTRQTLDGAIYAKELREATLAGRITRVPYDATKPVHTFWDLGWSDNTSIWFAQAVGFEYRVIDFMQDSQRSLSHYLGLLQSKGYVYGTDYLPHDAQAKTLAGAGRSVEQLMRAAGRVVNIVPRLNVADGINAARTIFANCWFDDTKCADGLQALRRYRYDIDEDGQWSRNPLHDDASHACLVAGEMVNTTRGLVPIEEVKIGDYVWTPCGISRVLQAGAVRYADELIEISGPKGRILTCTPEHKVFTKCGFVPAGQLTTRDSLLTGREWSSRLCSYLSAVAGIGFREGITGQRIGAMGRATCIVPSTSSGTALSLMGMMSIITTNVASTVIPTIWRLCPQANINGGTLSSGSPTGLSSRRRTWRASDLPSGTLVQKGSLGTPSTAGRPGMAESGWKRFAKNAVSRFARLILRAPSSATPIVRLRRFGGAEANQLVFDLTVEKNACYQANGMLVSNSDAFRYLAVSLKAPTVKRKVEFERLQRRPATAWMS